MRNGGDIDIRESADQSAVDREMVEDPEVNPPAGTPTAESPTHEPTKRRSRAHTADLVRVALFAAVVLAHSVNAVNVTAETVQPSGLIGVLCHLTRYGFVAITLYVLVISTQGKPMSPISFWRRRFGLVVGPYLLWTLIYAVTDHVLLPDNPFPSTGAFFADLWRDMWMGEGKYQLYFLLISMQIYLVFPAISWLLRRAQNRPWSLIAGGATIQIGMFLLYQYSPRPAGEAWVTTFDMLWKSLPMYALFVAIGALGAAHHDAIDEWLRAHAVPVIAASLMGVGFTVAAYLFATSPGNVPLQSTTPWNPALLPWLLGGTALLWLVAMAWNDHRGAGDGVVARVVGYSTPRAFGVFAVHPLILDAFGRFGFLSGLFEWFPGSAVTRGIVLVVATLVASALLVDILLRTPLSKMLVARSRRPLFAGRRPGTALPAQPA
nr:acyltransferase [Gordonia soli]